MLTSWFAYMYARYRIKILCLNHYQGQNLRWTTLWSILSETSVVITQSVDNENCEVVVCASSMSTSHGVPGAATMLRVDWRLFSRADWNVSQALGKSSSSENFFANFVAGPRANCPLNSTRLTRKDLWLRPSWSLIFRYSRETSPPSVFLISSITMS